MKAPFTITGTKEDMEKTAKSFMVRFYGEIPRQEGADQDAWFARYGMLMHFISEMFPE